MYSLTELLEPESAATVHDWYVYAQSILKDIDFSAGADTVTPQLIDKIKGTLPLKKLSSQQLGLILLVTGKVIDYRDISDDGFQITNWGLATQSLIHEELTSRLQNYAGEQNMVELINTALQYSKIRKRSIEQEFPVVQDFLSSVQQEIAQYQLQFNSLEHTEILEKENDFLQESANVAQKLVRYADMHTKLNSFAHLLSEYKAYVMQTITDSNKSKKLQLISSLSLILENKNLPMAARLYDVAQTIQKPENLAILNHDSWGAKLLSFFLDNLALLFERTPTASESYKSKLLELKLDVMSNDQSRLENQSSLTSLGRGKNQ